MPFVRHLVSVAHKTTNELVDGVEVHPLFSQRFTDESRNIRTGFDFKDSGI